MGPIRISNYGFPGALSELVGRASMQLPSVTAEGDAAFLKQVTGIIMMLFWSNYISDLPAELRTEARKVIDARDSEQFAEWVQKHCNVLEDENSMQRANRVLADLEAKLPTVLIEEYARFHGAQATA